MRRAEIAQRKFSTRHAPDTGRGQVNSSFKDVERETIFFGMIALVGFAVKISPGGVTMKAARFTVIDPNHPSNRHNTGQVISMQPLELVAPNVKAN